MRQPNTHHLRKFIDRVSVVGTGQSMAFTQKELMNTSLALTDLLLYQRELENEIMRLKDEIAQADTVTVELQGGSF